jgi:NAD(P)-dependent dehydrogenase (short-subunit alcohol dehydrogenase family)
VRRFEDLFRLDGKTSLVVGAGRGICEAAAIGLADFGSRVFCADVEGAEETASEIPARGGDAKAIALDMTDPEAVERAASEIGAVDVLVSSPSINVRKRLLEVTDDEFDRVVGLNMKGTLRLMRVFGRMMSERKSGSIIVFSSIRATVVESGQGVYAATKAGTLQMARVLATELGKDGVRMNAIAPGIVETPLTEQIKADENWYRAYAEKSVLGRWAKPEELVGPVVFLASEASSYVTGSYMLVDGGWTAADGRFEPSLGHRKIRPPPIPGFGGRSKNNTGLRGKFWPSNPLPNTGLRGKYTGLRGKFSRLAPAPKQTDNSSLHHRFTARPKRFREPPFESNNKPQPHIPPNTRLPRKPLPMRHPKHPRRTF